MSFFDETDDHVAIAGPSGTAIIQYFACKKFAEMTSRKSFKSLEERDFVFDVYSLQHHRALANTVMVNVKEISVAKIHHMTNIQLKSMFWYVMITEEIQKMNSFF